MKPKTLPICSLISAVVLTATTLQAVDRIKADNADTLNLGSSWVGGVPPGSGDVGVWNSTVTANLFSALGADLNWSGIRIADPAGPINIGVGNALTLGAAGIDLSAANQDLTLDNDLTIGASQTWNVGTGRTLTVSTGLGGVLGLLLTKEGDGTLVLSSTNLGTFAGDTVINGGVLELNGRNPNSNNHSAIGTGSITNNSSTLRLHEGRIMGNVLHFNGTCIVDANGFASPLDGAWSGAADITIINFTSGGTFTIGGNGNGGGNMNGFTGTLRLADDTVGTLRFNNGGGNNNVGNADAVFDLGNSSAFFFSRNRNATVNFGELRGGPGTTIRQGASSSGMSTYNIGGKDTSTTFEGSIVDGGTTSAGLVRINKVGTGTLTLTGTNMTYLGGTAVTEGTLQIGNGGTSGDLGLGDVDNNATLTVNRADNFSLVNNFSGGGQLRKVNSNVLTLDGTNSSSGITIIEEGTLALGATGEITAPIAVASGASFDVSAAASFVLGSTLAGEGTVSGALSAANALISPGYNEGNGNGVAGTLNFAGSLTQNGGVITRFDLSDDTTGTIKDNDAVAITGDLSLTGENTILVSSLDPLLTLGTYRLITFTGVLNGDVTNNLSLSGAVGYLTTNNSPNAIDLVVTVSRPGTNLTWVGDSVNNKWDLGVSPNWNDGSGASIFFSQDTVTFDGTGSTTPPVDLVGLLSPASVLVNSATDYTFAGNGAIFGTGGLSKSGSGTLSVRTVNGYSGPTTVNGGTLVVSNIVNGSQPSGLGASPSDAANLVLGGGTTLRYDGESTATDRSATLGGAVTLNVEPAPANLQIDGNLIGSTTLTKDGAGTLTLGVASSYEGSVVLSNGVLALGSNAANNSGGESGLGQTTNTVTFYGGTLELFGYNGGTGNNYATLFNPLIVPVGQEGTLRLFPRGPSNSGGASGLQSSLAGGGTLNLVVNYLRDNLSGDWSEFTGLINVTARNGADEMRINNSFGYANATIFLNDGVSLGRADTANTVNDIGALGGTSLAVVGPGNNTGNTPTWRVGWKNTDAEFAGTIADDDGPTTIVKVGTGTWTLSGFSTYTGPTVISNGVLSLGFSGGLFSTNINVRSGAAFDVSGLGTYFLNAGQTLGGNGTVWGIVDNSPGGTIAPGLSVGTLTVTNSVSLGGAGVAEMELDRNGGAFISDKVVAPNITLGGTLRIRNAGAPLQIGDTFDLFDGVLSGAFTTFEFGYASFDTSQLGVNGTITVTGVTPPPTLSVSSDGLNITLSSSGGIAGGGLTVITSTDVSDPLGSWDVVMDDFYDGSGNYMLLIPIDSGTPQRYYAILAY